MYFVTSCIFLLFTVTLLFKIAPFIVLKSCMVFLSARSLWWALKRKHVRTASFSLSYSAVGVEHNLNNDCMIHPEKGRGHSLICTWDRCGKCKSNICSAWWSCGKDGKVTIFVDLWDDSNKKGIVDIFFPRLKTQKFIVKLSKVKEMLNPFQLMLAASNFSKGDAVWKILGLKARQLWQIRRLRNF